MLRRNEMTMMLLRVKVETAVDKRKCTDVKKRKTVNKQEIKYELQQISGEKR